MLPVIFAGCAGWLHPAAGRHGVLLCGALNHELLPLYKSWHALAAMIAETGLPVLRFDYHGTGDSLGDDREPRRLEAWVDSIHAAARFMHQELGIDTVDLVGIRLGATLAALTAADIGVERLALIAPVVSGRSYIREAQARSRMFAGMWRLDEASATRGDIINDGFMITRETAAEISRIDLAALAVKPADDLMILSEKPAPATAKFVQRLGAMGCTVTRDTFAGFAACMDSATLATIPFEDWRKVVSFLAEGREGMRVRVVLPRHHALSTSFYREERMTFGKGDCLAGILCQPLGRNAVATVIFLNTGGNPHFGWGRMTVEHARALAARGIASLRMDIAGIGDSVLLGENPGAALYSATSIIDLQEALDLLQARGLSNFAVVGHCSGAWLALHGALAEKRVRRLFLVNLQRFIWTGKEDLETLMAQAYRATESYLQEIGSGTVWRRLLKGDLNWPRLPGIAGSIIRRAAMRVNGTVWRMLARVLAIETETAHIAGMLENLSERGTRVLLVYSDTDPGREELARHFGRSGRRLQMPGIQIATIANADHDITSEEARSDYFDLLSDHLGCRGGSDRAAISAERQALVAHAA
jgi:pimeloyl-ACP methyl ester carboxylesterase